MKKHLSDEYVVLLRTHYYIADAIDTTGVEDFVVNVCRYNDIAELYLISDILITDYSSVFFDYAGLKRPMLFCTYDLEKYRDFTGKEVYWYDHVLRPLKNLLVGSKEYTLKETNDEIAEFSPTNIEGGDNS